MQVSGKPLKNCLHRFTTTALPGLTNGAVGHIYKIIYGPGEKPPMLPRAILVIFDGYIGPTFPNRDNIQKLVPIVPVTHTWKKNKTMMTRTALPVILGYALTIHKEDYFYDVVKMLEHPPSILLSFVTPLLFFEG